MEIQCGGCSRTFRIPDSRVTAAGVKFKCTKCGAIVQVTPEDLQAMNMSSETAQPRAAEPQFAEHPTMPDTPAAAPPVAQGDGSAPADTIHPLVSGSLAGAFGGVGCAVPVLAMTLLGIGSLSLLAGGKGMGVSLGKAMLVNGASVVGFGVLIGIVLAFFQTRSENSIFGFPGVLIGTSLGLVLGAVKGAIAAAGSGVAFSAAVVFASMIGWGVKALLLSIAVVLARRAVAASSKESISAEISGGQLLGIGLACLVAFLGIYGEVHAAANMKSAREAAAKSFQDMASAEGLEVAGTSSSWDPATGDLILNVSIANKGETEKKMWYLLARTYDGSGNVLSTMKMLTGKQVYTQRDFEIMRRRGADVGNVMREHMQEPDTPLPAHGTLDVAMRVMEPPSGIASFDATFEPFDPLKMMKEQLEEMGKQNAGAGSAQGQ